MLSNRVCRYTGVYTIVHPTMLLSNEDYIHPIVMMVKKEMVNKERFINLLQQIIKMVYSDKESTVYDKDFLRESFIITRIALTLLLSENQDAEIEWKQPAFILSEGFQLTHIELILEIKYLIFIQSNINKLKIRFAYIDALRACSHVYDRMRQIIDGEIVLTDSGASPPVVLHSYDPSIKIGDCENFCELAELSRHYKANYNEFDCVMHHGKFRSWINLNLLQRVHSAIMAKSHEVYDESDRVLQRYRYHAEEMASFFFEYDLITGRKIRVKTRNPTSLVTIPVSFKTP